MPVLVRLRALRERAFLTQIELAELAGLTQAALSRLENGTSARRSTALRLAAALGVEPTELLAPLEPRTAP